MYIKAFNSYIILIKKSWLFALSVAVILILFGIKISAAHADNITIGGPKDCNANAVIYCGADSATSLISKYNNGDGVNSAASIQNIYSYFGINSGNMTAMGNGSYNVVPGTVNTVGDVYANGQEVATGATTAGRQDIAGSTKEDINGTIFYVRPPSVSFEASSLPAYVMEKDGQFVFALLASCGNPIKATAIPAPKPQPTPTAPSTTTTKPAPAPTISVCSGNTTNVNNGGIASQGGNCSTNTTVVQTQNNTETAKCSSLSVDVNQSNPLAVSVTANPLLSDGINVADVTYNFGDGTVTSPSTDTTMTHTYATAGSYTIVASLSFTGGTSSVPTSTCQAAFTATTTPAPQPAVAVTTTPAQPTIVSTQPAATTLVNTGPGSVIAIFAGVTALGTLLFSILKKRSLIKSN